MKAFTIDAENNITIHASRKDALAAGGLVFASGEQLADDALTRRSGADLVEIFNSFTGVTPVKKFMDRKAAARRIWAECEKMAAAEAPICKGMGTTCNLTNCVCDTRRFGADKAKAEPAKAAKPTADTTQASGPRANSKTAQLIEMLKEKGGATLEAVCKRFGWQAHTTRALMSAGGALAKKHGITVISEKVGETRNYRIAS